MELVKPRPQSLGVRFELAQLRHFIILAEELNYRRAAERLNMSQPPLTRHIQAQEHALGLRLFDRSKRSARLTPGGARFLTEAVAHLQRAGAAALFAHEAGAGTTGALVLGFVPSAAPQVIPRIARALRDQLPGLNLTLREMMTHEQVESLAAGSLDLGLVRLPDRAPALALQRVWSEPFALAIPRTHPLASKPDLGLADLEGVDFIAYSTERGGFCMTSCRATCKAWAWCRTWFWPCRRRARSWLWSMPGWGSGWSRPRTG